MIELRTPTQIEQMRPAGRFVADVLTALEDAADVGVNLLDLDALAHRMIRERGAESCYLDYHPSLTDVHSTFPNGEAPNDGW